MTTTSLNNITENYTESFIIDKTEMNSMQFLGKCFAMIRGYCRLLPGRCGWIGLLLAQVTRVNTQVFIFWIPEYSLGLSS